MSFYDPDEFDRQILAERYMPRFGAILHPSCGTERGYQHHLELREPSCPACNEVRAAAERRRRALAEQRGLCTRCRCRPVDAGYKRCEPCRIKSRHTTRTNKAKVKA